MLKCAGDRIDVLLLFTNTVFSSASRFNGDLSAWDVRVVADMTDMFLGPIGSLTHSQLQTLCGYHWMQSSTAQLAFPTLPQIAIDKNGTICHCPRGTYYQSRVWPPIPHLGIVARLETCPPCPSGQYSPGGKVPATFCSECPAGFYCVTPAVKADCPLGAYCSAKSTFPKALTAGYYAVNALNNYTRNQGVADRECEKGYYCSGGNRIQCTSGSACPQGSSFSAVCPKGQYTNDDWLCVECEAGHVCEGGIRKQCAIAGTYCATGSSVVADCRAGFECRTPATETKCLDGSYCPLKSRGSIDCPAGFYCATPAVQVECPKGSYCLAKSMLPVALASGHYAVNAFHTYTITQGVAERVCEKGYYCSGGVRTECSKGEFCPLGASAPRPCLKGSFCNVTFIQGLVPVWGTSEKPCMSGTYCPRGTSEPYPCADGATCFVPASPELVLEPDIFDLIESEVDGSIQYHLSLSAQPNASVIVKIEVIIKSEECYAYSEPSKLKLDRVEFEFGPDNYNISQIVVSHFLSQTLLRAHFFTNIFFTNTFVRT